jgi:site-specific DNA recombinase
MVEVFDAREVSFVAVTQQFNTTTSMGRLTLNVLLSFAQFEREVTGERIRDKIAASKQKGMWMGGMVPIGYDVRERRLVVNESEAETVREIFRSYLELGSVRRLMEELNRRGIRSKVRVAKNGRKSGGKAFSRGALYELLSNPIYIGEIRHRGVRHPGLHEPIVNQELWDKTQLLLRSHAARRASRTTRSSASPLTGKLFDESGRSLTPSHAVKDERRYRYYVSRTLTKVTADSTERGWRLPAREIEGTVAAAARQILSERTALAIAAQAIGLAEHRLPSVFSVAEAWNDRLQSEVEADAALTALVGRVDLSDSGMRLALQMPIPIAGSHSSANAIELVVTRFFPMIIRRRGVEMRLVIRGNGAPAPQADSALLKAVARAHWWSEDLLTGRAQSVDEIADRERVGARYVRRMLSLAFLAPKIVEAIATGDQPSELTAEALAERIDLPLLWTAQAKAVGIAS